MSDIEATQECFWELRRRRLIYEKLFTFAQKYEK